MLSFDSKSIFQNELLYAKFTSETARQVYKNGVALSYQTSGSSGFDIRAISVALFNDELSALEGELDLQNNTFVIPPGERALVKAGIMIAIRNGTEIQIRSRSGLALKSGVFVLNSPGTVDSDYRGEIGATLFNTSKKPFIVSLGDRIAQAVICPVIIPQINFVDELDETARGKGGYGSTGIK